MSERTIPVDSAEFLEKCAKFRFIVEVNNTKGATVIPPHLIDVFELGNVNRVCLEMYATDDHLAEILGLTKYKNAPLVIRVLFVSQSGGTDNGFEFSGVKYESVSFNRLDREDTERLKIRYVFKYTSKRVIDK